MFRITTLQVFLILIVSILISPEVSFSAEIPSGMVIGDNQGIQVKRNGEYLINVIDVMPGKSWHTTISMINMEKDGSYSLGLLISKPTVSGILDLSEAIQMTLNYQGKTVFSGPVSGINESQNLQIDPLDLGVFQAGDSKALEVDFSISGDYTNKDFEIKNLLENIWTFTAVKANEPNTKKTFGKLPNTGEQIRQAIIFFCVGLFLLLIVLLILKEKRIGRMK